MALKAQPTLSEQVLQSIAAHLEHEVQLIRRAAMNMLQDQPNLSDERLQGIACQFLTDRFA